MAQPSGMIVMACKFCGRRYLRTNWMIRYGVRGYDGRLLRDTHQIACNKKLRTAQAQGRCENVPKPICLQCTWCGHKGLSEKFDHPTKSGLRCPSCGVTHTFLVFCRKSSRKRPKRRRR